MVIPNDPEFKVCFDFGRPSYYGESCFVWWEQFYRLIEGGPERIILNKAYPLFRDHCFKRINILGGCFKFQFWFESEEVLQGFIEKVRAIPQDGTEHHALLPKKVST